MKDLDPVLRKGRAVFLAAGVLVAGFAGLIWIRYRHEIGQERRRVSTGSQIAPTRCGPIEYAATGSGSPVLVVHGAGGGFDQGMSLGEPLARRGLRVIAMSRFGYLRTPLPADASAAAQADAHACLLDALGIRRAAILGASAGAPSSVQFVLRHPDRSSALVLLVPAIYAPRPGGAPPVKTPAGTRFLFETALKSDFLFWAAIRFARPVVTRAILATPPEVIKNADAAEQARAADILEQILPVSARRAGLLNDAAVTSSLSRYELERVAVPTLVISVADDLFGTFDGARYTAEHVPGARFKGYPSGGHVWVGHHEEILAEIAAFLVTRFGDLDLSFRPAGTEGFSDLTLHAVEMRIRGLKVPVAALEDVIRSKEAADRPKDRRSLPVLRQLLEEVRKRQR